VEAPAKLVDLGDEPSMGVDDTKTEGFMSAEEDVTPAPGEWFFDL